MNKGETWQAWREFQSHPAWKLLCQNLQVWQDRAWLSLLGQCRDKDSTNGYWAGYYEALEKVLKMPEEEVDRIDG
jgi:hypothetical protein